MKRVVCFVILICLAAGASAQDVKREVIYGAEIMTRAERESYRQDLQRAKTEDDAKQVRERHREQIQKRARARGETLTEAGLLQKKEKTERKQ